MKRNTRQLYETIMKNISYEIKNILNEEFDIKTNKRLGDYANRKAKHLMMDYRNTGYQDEDILKHLQFLSRMSKKLADKANKQIVEQVQGKLKEVINKWKNGVKIDDDIIFTPIFEIEEVQDDDEETVKLYLNVYTIEPEHILFNIYNPDDVYKEMRKKAAQIRKTPGLSKREKDSKIRKMEFETEINMYEDERYEKFLDIRHAFNRIERKLQNDLENLYLTWNYRGISKRNEQYKGYACRSYSLPDKYVSDKELENTFNDIFSDYLEEDPNKIKTRKEWNGSVIKRSRII